MRKKIGDIKEDQDLYILDPSTKALFSQNTQENYGTGGALKYYIFSKGVYTVGRKGCDLIIQTDRTISRVHAEIVVDAMTCQDPLQLKSSSHSDVHIKDLSKFGTFINKETGSNPVFSSPNKVATLKIGDLVSFGTANATFRFSFVPIVIFCHSAKPSKTNHALQDYILSIGACATHKWSADCTHVVTDESSRVTESLIDAIVACKPVIRSDWVKVVADKKISAEIPSCSLYVPTLTLEGEENSTSVQIVEPKVREKCLAGYTFVLGSLNMYKFAERLSSLLEVSGAKVLHADLFCSSNQTLADGMGNRIVKVVPDGSANEFNPSPKLISLPRVKDITLVAAVLSGHFDADSVESACMVVSSSHSTDETRIPDSDVDMDTAASVPIIAAIRLKEATEPECDVGAQSRQAGPIADMVETSKSKVGGGGMKERRDKGKESEQSDYQNSDIIYSQDLIVRTNSRPTSSRATSVKETINYKCFRKIKATSGNSFKDLISFAKEPYKESDCASEASEYAREEKKRKKMEAIADDLFNTEKAKRQRGIAGQTLQSLMMRR